MGGEDAFEWLPRWRAAHARLWPKSAPAPSVPAPSAPAPAPSGPNRWSTPKLTKMRRKREDEAPLIRLIVAELPQHPELSDILVSTAYHYGCLPEHLTGPSRLVYYVRPRQIAITLARELIGGTTWCQLGRDFNRDHTTIINAVRRHSAKIKRILSGE